MQRHNPAPTGRISNLRWLVLGMLAASSAAPLSAEDPVPTYALRYQFRAGSSVDYTVENDSKIQVEQAESEQQVEHREMTHKHYRVMAVEPDGSAMLELMIDRAQMSAALDGGEPVTYDSQSDIQP
ncbi:MAG: hypothetical protein KF861_18730, partial [Planctomycetaceae bacterium]|nr:hypothetical protein [Planctomycetaceae bacterium]